MIVQFRYLLVDLRHGLGYHGNHPAAKTTTMYKL